MAVHPGMISARTSLRALAIIPLAVVLLGWLGVQIGVRLFFRARLLHYDNLSGSGSDWSDSSSDEDDEEEDEERAFWAQGARGAAAPVEGAEAPAVGRACAAHHFAGERESDLSFVRGDEVELLDASADDWWRGRLRDGTEGTFPANFVERVEIFPTGPVAREDEELQPAPRTRPARTRPARTRQAREARGVASSLSKFFLRLCVSTVAHGKSLLIAAVAFGWSWVVGVRTPRISRTRRAAGVLLLAAGLYSARSFARSLPWRLLGLGGTRRKQLPPAAPEPEPEPQQIASAQRQALDDLHAAATAAAAAGRRAKQGPMRMAEVIDAIRAEISTPSDADAEQNLTAKVHPNLQRLLANSLQG